MLAAVGYACDGLLLLAYPAPSAGKPDDCAMPTSENPGTCAMSEWNSRSAMHTGVDGILFLPRQQLDDALLTGADHSFHAEILGRTDSDVMAELSETVGL